MTRQGHAGFCNKDHAPGATPCARVVPDPARALTPLELFALQNDDVVYDATGDQWTKVDGLWVCRDAKMSSESLTHVWGPITKEEQ